MSRIIGVLAALFIVCSGAFALGEPENLCDRSVNLAKVRAADPLFHIAFLNHGGLLNGGVCWWHSLFQRATLYLAAYKPERPKPNREAAELIVREFIEGRSVVEIPGYENISQFSRDFGDLIQASLERWQKTDGFVRQKWIGNITSPPRLPAGELGRRMRRLFEVTMVDGEIPWVMLKIPGLTAHAWLVVAMAPTRDGFDLQVIDSNFPGTLQNVAYEFGQTAVKTVNGPVVPYLGRQSDLIRFARAIETYCRR